MDGAPSAEDLTAAGMAPAPRAPLAVVFDMGGVLAPDADYAPVYRRLPDDADRDAVKAAISAAWERGRTAPGLAMEEHWRPVMEAAGLAPGLRAP